jgi:hypothetical protein
MYCGNTGSVTATSARDIQPVVNMPNIIDGAPNDIMVNYCDKEQHKVDYLFRDEQED